MQQEKIAKKTASDLMNNLWKKKFEKKINQDLQLFEEVINCEVIEKEIKPFASGASGHFILPKTYVGRKVKVIILKDKGDLIIKE